MMQLPMAFGTIRFTLPPERFLSDRVLRYNSSEDSDVVVGSWNFVNVPVICSAVAPSQRFHAALARATIAIPAATALP